VRDEVRQPGCSEGPSVAGRLTSRSGQLSCGLAARPPRRCQARWLHFVRTLAVSVIMDGARLGRVGPDCWWRPDVFLTTGAADVCEPHQAHTLE
jgi:hypothetical protein